MPLAWDDDGLPAGERMALEGAGVQWVLPVGELVLIAPYECGAEHVSVFTRVGGDNWIVPRACVHVALPPSLAAE